MGKSDKDTDMGNRLKKAINYIVYMEELNSQKDVASLINKDKTNLSKAINGDTLYIKGYYEALCNKYSFFSKDWFVTGKGNMFIRDIPNVPESPGVAVDTEEDYQQAINEGLHLLPEVTFKFTAGQTQLINIIEDITRYWYLPDCKDCEGVAQVVGRSMSPALPSGCWVALKKYTLPKDNPNTIPFGNIFGVVVEDKDTGDYCGHIKILRRHKEQSLSNKYWIAHSVNDTEFDDFDIEIKQVRSLWIVKQHIVSDIL